MFRASSKKYTWSTGCPEPIRDWQDAQSTFVKCFDLFRFPRWFVKLLCSWVWLISLTTCWCVLSEEMDLDSTSFVWFCWHQLTITVMVPWLMSGVQFATELIALDFRKKTMEKMGTRRKSYLFSKFFVTNLQFGKVRFFFNVSEVSVFFLVFPHNRQLKHRWCAEGSAEAPGSKVLPQWTLNLRVYAHTCTQTKEI